MSYTAPQLPDRHFLPLHVVAQLASLGCGLSGLDSANRNLCMYGVFGCCIFAVGVVVIAATVEIEATDAERFR